MKFDFLKKIASKAWYRTGTAHRILAGPMKAMWFKCSDNTGLAALYSSNEHDLEVARLLTESNYLIQRVDGSPIKHPDRSWPDPDGVWGTLHAMPQ